MKKNKQITGIIGIGGIVLLLAVIIYSMVSFEKGFSPLGCFITELGFYTGGYMSMSPALIFNLGFIICGLVICAFFVNYGIQKSTKLNAAVSFFGMLSGVLLAAKGIFTLNFSQYHYIVSSAFFASVFVMSILFITDSMLSSNLKKSNLANIIVAFFAGLTSVVFSGYTITGGMEKVFLEDSSVVGRLSIIPFAIIEWAAAALIIALFSMLAIQMFLGSRDTQSGGKNPLRFNFRKVTGKPDSRSIEL